MKNIKKSQIDIKRTNLCSSEPYVVPARISVGWFLAGTLKLLNELWPEELPADPHCPAACWHQPQSQWYSHLNHKSVNNQQMLSWTVLANFSDVARLIACYTGTISVVSKNMSMILLFWRIRHSIGVLFCSSVKANSNTSAEANVTQNSKI